MRLFNRKRRPSARYAEQRREAEDLATRYPLGRTVQYLGTSMVVTGHWELLVVGLSAVHVVRLCLDYLDSGGNLHKIAIDYDLATSGAVKLRSKGMWGIQPRDRESCISQQTKCLDNLKLEGK